MWRMWKEVFRDSKKMRIIHLKEAFVCDPIFGIKKSYVQRQNLYFRWCAQWHCLCTLELLLHYDPFWHKKLIYYSLIFDSTLEISHSEQNVPLGRNVHQDKAGPCANVLYIQSMFILLIYTGPKNSSQRRQKIFFLFWWNLKMTLIINTYFNINIKTFLK